MSATGFEWKAAGGTYTKQPVTPSGSTLTHTLTGLTLGTTYYVRAYATTPQGDTYGNEITFSTLSIVPPTVTTNDASNLNYASATLNGSVVKGDLNITDKGFEWKKVSDANYTTVSKGASAGTITHNLTGLQPNTQYTYRAYGTTSGGTVFGEDKTFTTPAIVPPTVTTSAATAIGKNSATLNGTIMNGSYAIIAYGFEYKITGALDYTSISGTKSGTTLTATINSLAHNINYTFRAYATTAEEGTTYGTELTFKTLYNQLIIESGDTVAISTPFNGDLVFYHGGQIGNTTDTIIQIEGKIEYKRKFTRNLWYSVIFPFDVARVTYGQGIEITPYRNGSGKFLLKQHNDNTSMNFIERWEDTPTPPAGIIIAKNVPYIIQVQSLVLNNREITFHSANSTHSIGNKTFVLYDNGNTTAFNYFGNNTLRPQTIGTCYIIEDQLFRRQDGTTSVPAFECYVQATPTVMKSMPYIGIMKEAGGTTETANTLYPYTLQTWSDNANVYIRSTVDQDIAIYNINGAC
ncbi:MAG TPA: hypothetical protein PLR63_08615, partial [Paludibacteraceae bacterium]|nr:hypothetical protein [Paludibacteraceae bacterium]